MDISARIEAVVAAQDYGRPSAVKRGRNPAFPYVPVLVKAPHGAHASRTENPCQGVAFATREEAVARCEVWIAAARSSLRSRLAEPRHRALREQHGLPREIV